MADSVIGALRVLLGVDTAAFSSGLKDAQGTLNNFGSSFKKLAAQLSIAAVAAKFVYDINSMINKADELGKAAQKFGVPVEQLSALKYAADLADVSFESLSKGLGKLSKAMLDAAANPAGEAAKSFKALGISVTDSDGKLRSVQAVFGDVAEKFSKVEDGAAKTALAIRVFGRAGADLIPLLNEGRAGLKALTDEAAALGIVISDKTAASAQEFNDTLKRLGATKDAIILKITEGMLPGLNQLAKAWLENAKQGTVWQEVGKTIVEVFNQIVYAIEVTALGVRRLGAEWQAFKAIFSATTFADLSAAWQNFNKVTAESDLQLFKLKLRYTELEDPIGVTADALAGLGTKGKKSFEDINTSALGAKSALQSFIDSQYKSIAAQVAEAQAIGQGVGVREQLKVTLEAQQIALANNIPLTKALSESITALSLAAKNAAIDVAAAQLKQEALTPWDLYLQKLRDINAEVARHPELQNAAAIAAAKAASVMIDAYGTAAATAMGQFAEFFSTFSKGNKELFLISKAFSISQAIINTFVGATKALATLPPPLGEIAAAAVIAAGMASVAKIIAEKPPTMALGGSLQVKGAGGVDSQMVPIMATPGERVSVDQNKYGESAGGSRTITVQGIKPKDYFTGDVLRDLVANLNTAIGDGLKIKLV